MEEDSDDDDVEFDDVDQLSSGSCHTGNGIECELTATDDGTFTTPKNRFFRKITWLFSASQHVQFQSQDAEPVTLTAESSIETANQGSQLAKCRPRRGTIAGDHMFSGCDLPVQKEGVNVKNYVSW